MGKTWHFITKYIEQTKANYLATTNTKENQKKNSLGRVREQKKT
jgi:hypothetical protein